MDPEASWEDLENRVIQKSVTDEDFRRRLVQDPKGTLQAELSAFSENARIPDLLEVRVIEETPTTIHIVLPPPPDEDLEVQIWEPGLMVAAQTRRSCTCSRRCCA